jgi:hypothetical protein
VKRKAAEKEEMERKRKEREVRDQMNLSCSSENYDFHWLYMQIICSQIQCIFDILIGTSSKKKRRTI